ncbi:glycosyltransferase family protein [Arthrobacter sp. SX1312]|uniref:glycosyltransferase family protein n=1 Tax=Arthrobacter sp. SX1312 TaxID=2058896 RepID=UPI0011B0DFD8|nr:glycosyl transferase family 28 [Arthrobacter sp. SX1312]
MADLQPEELRVVLYSHDSQGLGHTRRNLAIAHALSAGLPGHANRKVTGLLVTGESSATRFDVPAGWDWVVLPGIRKSTEGYRPRHLTIGQDALIQLRMHMIDAVFDRFRPHLVVVDRHAFGVDGELGQALTNLRLRRPACKVVLGLREVLDSPHAMEQEWSRMGGIDVLAPVFDQIWVYGDPAIHDPLGTGEIPGTLGPLVRYTGYLAAGRVSRGRSTPVGQPYVLTMAGGGSDGLALLLAAAGAEVPEGYGHLVITGPQMPKEHRRLVERAAGPGTSVVVKVRDALSEIEGASAIVSMGGYNSVSEIMTTSAPALIVPRTEPRMEQLIRASALARHGVVEMCHPDDLSPELIGAWFGRAAGTRVGRSTVDLTGVAALAPLAAELLATEAGSQDRRWVHAAV